MILLYDPAQLAEVAAGRMPSHTPQPYATVRLNPDLFFSPDCEIFSATFDARGRVLFVTEFVRDPDGALVVHALRVDAVATSAGDVPAPRAAELQVFPNPVRAGATVRYLLPSAGEVRLQLVDVLGRVVATLVDGHGNGGPYAAAFDATALGLPAGPYMLRLRHAGRTTLRPVLLVR